MPRACAFCVGVCARARVRVHTWVGRRVLACVPAWVRGAWRWGSGWVGGRVGGRADACVGAWVRACAQVRMRCPAGVCVWCALRGSRCVVSSAWVEVCGG